MTRPQPRLPWADLGAQVDARGMSMSQLARESGIARRVILRWKAEGALPERAADRMAVAIGLTPDLVWGQAWAQLGAESLAQVEAEEAERAAERRRRDAARKRADRIANPEKWRIKTEAWKRANLSAHHRYMAWYREQNRERLRAYARERYRQQREGLHLHVRQGQDRTGQADFRNLHSGLQGGQNRLIGPYSTPATGHSPADGVTLLADNGATEQEVG